MPFVHLTFYMGLLHSHGNLKISYFLRSRTLLTLNSKVFLCGSSNKYKKCHGAEE